MTLFAIYKLRPAYPHFKEITKTFIYGFYLNCLNLFDLVSYESFPIIVYT